MSDPHRMLDVALDAAQGGRLDDAQKICSDIARLVKSNARGYQTFSGDEMNRKYPHFTGPENEIRKAHWYLNHLIDQAQQGASWSDSNELPRTLENIKICLSHLHPENSDNLDVDSAETRRLSQMFGGVQEGPSGYTTAFTHPDPIDPNDELRQRTQARAGNYPYDMPVSYGSPQGTDDGGASYQRSPDMHPPRARRKRPGDVMPIGQRGNAWEQLEALTNYEPGPQAPDAAELGYGNMGRMGDGLDPGELDLDALRNDFRSSFLDTRPQAHAMGRKGLFALLVQLDPEYSAELFGPDDDDEACSIYDDWGQHVYAPGAEHDEDEETDDEDYPE